MTRPPPPPLSTPILATASQLKANPLLTSQIITLANSAFTRAKATEPERWHIPSIRFPDNSSFYSMLGPKGFVAILLDNESCDSNSAVENYLSSGSLEKNADEVELRRGKVIACLAVVPWKGGFAKECADTEKGWEIKAVSVDGDAKYLRRGLAIRLLSFVETYLVSKERERASLSMNTGGCEKTGPSIVSEKEKHLLTLWILAAESQAAPYWRKRGYTELRRSTQGAGVWGCKTSFEMVVLKRDVEFLL